MAHPKIRDAADFRGELVNSTPRCARFFHCSGPQLEAGPAHQVANPMLLTNVTLVILPHRPPLLQSSRGMTKVSEGVVLSYE